MKLFDLDSPLISTLNKVADLMLLNILTMICCIPIFTIGPALTAMHYMALKIVRNEECYIARGFFKSFKENFKQGVVIGFILLLVTVIIVGDFFIITKSGINVNIIFKIIILAAALLVLFTGAFVFPVLAKFDNTVKRTIKNAFIMSILQFPKTILMIVAGVAPFVAAVYIYQAFPIVFMFGLSVPAWFSALLYNNFFKRIEDQILAETAPEPVRTEGEEDERIFKDELDESICINEEIR